MSAAAARRARRRNAAAELRNRRRMNRPHTVKPFLRSLGYETAFVERYASPFGRHAAKAYRAAHDGRDPQTTRRRVNGKLRTVFQYQPGDPALTIALSTYKRTAEYAPAA
ncbi:hypothetical protein [Streptomyces tirandamycinicus]|uniref:Uncharacterized protein n=1 Tax=Streptomyces tirandamycinicus TaxID=2174846 RepID=A0A2S1T1U5_9ACTN|nr:hypothetical protein [Streptomyces tirandamycinicus]AWI32644.1 hypothetical protein DDW44_30460 [Streptomyces tirandamycinicus]